MGCRIGWRRWIGFTLIAAGICILTLAHITSSILTSSLRPREVPYWSGSLILICGLIVLFYSSWIQYYRDNNTYCAALFKAFCFCVCLGVSITAVLGAYYMGYRIYTILTYDSCHSHVVTQTLTSRKIIDCICVERTRNDSLRISDIYHSVPADRSFGCTTVIEQALLYCLSISSVLCFGSFFLTFFYAFAILNDRLQSSTPTQPNTYRRFDSDSLGTRSFSIESDPYKHSTPTSNGEKGHISLSSGDYASADELGLERMKIMCDSSFTSSSPPRAFRRIVLDSKEYWV